MNLDWHTVLGTTASVVMLVLIVPYVRSILRESTKPSPVSWFGWMLLYVIAAAAQASKGIDWSLAISIIGIVSTSIVLIVALRTGNVVWTRADRFCIATAVLAIVLWAITKEPLTALILGLVADLAVSIPTIYKTYLEPSSEPWLLWVIYTTAVFSSIVATRDLTIYNLLSPLYSLFVDILITLAALRIFWGMKSK
ncbi:MAG: hypothetical protein WAV50_03975 [Minisyncoccia bacterium]